MYVTLILALTPSWGVVVSCHLSPQQVSGDVFASVKVNTLNHEKSSSADAEWERNPVDHEVLLSVKCCSIN